MIKVGTLESFSKYFILLKRKKQTIQTLKIYIRKN